MLVRRGLTCFTVATLMLLAASASDASALSSVRFLNATTRASVAHLEVTSTATGIATGAGGDSTFGQVTPYAAAPSGSVRLVLVASGVDAQLKHVLSPGAHYTVVATSSGRAGTLHVYQDGAGQPGTARVRVIHMAPELGDPNIVLGNRPIAQHVPFGANTGYLSMTPGAYLIQVVSPSGQAVAQGTLPLAAGTASTAFVIGSGGKPVQIAQANDSTVTPGGPPETGLGGLAEGGGQRWLWIALAGLAGALLAGSAQVAVRRRR